MNKSNGGTSSFSASLRMGSGQQNIHSLLNAGVRHHQTGKLDAAAQNYQRVLELDPRQADAMHLLGVVAYQKGDNATAERLIREAIAVRGDSSAFCSNLGLVLMGQDRLEEAAEEFQRAGRLDPSNADAWFNLGIVRHAQRRCHDAIACHRKALELQPNHLQALQNLGGTYQIIEDFKSAISTYRRALSLEPRFLAVLLNLGSSHEAVMAYEEAKACYEKALALEPGNSTAIAGLGSVTRFMGDTDEALEWSQRAVSADPGNPDACKNLGLVLKELGRLEEACAAFEKNLEILRRPGNAEHGDRRTFCGTHRAKLKHDIEQFSWLRERGLLPERWQDLPERYQSVLDRLPEDIGEGRIINMPRWALDEIGSTYNRLVYRGDGRELSRAVNSELDRKVIEKDYFAHEPGFTYIDGLLTPEALQNLRAFCMDSTFWFDFSHSGGYVGAYLEDGFYCPLLLQIARELPKSLPGIFGNHHLMQMWAYKYDSRLTGIQMHADFAAVNVNFWVTPDEANLEEDTGGLIVWNKEAPPEWGFEEYNTSDDSGQARIREFLREQGAEPYDVPHRQNRAVVFNSDLFHKTGEIRFREGYENRRINITMLFGKREQS